MSGISLTNAIFGSADTNKNDSADGKKGLFRDLPIVPKKRSQMDDDISSDALKKKDENSVDVNAETDNDKNKVSAEGKRVSGGKKRMRIMKAAAAKAAKAARAKEEQAIENVDERDDIDTNKEDKRIIQEKANKDEKLVVTEEENKSSTSDDDDEEDKETSISNKTKNDRTVFVGNLPLATTTRKSLHKVFAECGKIESTRVRSVAVEGVKLPKENAGNQSMMKKVCANTNLVLTDVKETVNGYVVFEDADSVSKALLLNNTLIEGRYIRVDTAKPSLDSSRSVFVGNLPYAAKEEELRAHFKTVGEVENVRVVRDSETQKCKGFAYILFKDKEIVADALRLDGTKCCKREIRVQVCGKRFKGKRGHETEINESKFEGRRATEGARKRILSNLKSKKMVSSKTTLLPKSKRRSRVEKPSIGKDRTNGMSRRASAEAKTTKREKKLQKRIELME